MAGPNPSIDPLASFQAKMNSILAQANAQLQQTSHDLQTELQQQESQFHHPSSHPSTLPPPNINPTQKPLPPQPPTIPPCQARNPVPNTHWYGWPDCSICPSCFSSFAAPTPLVPTMPLQNTFFAAHIICDMYSPRQRARYLVACRTGDVEALLAASRERNAVYQETVGVVLEMEAERDLARAKAEIMTVSAGHNAMIERYRGIGSLGEETRDEWRTDSGGVYSSWHGVVTEREGNEADALWERAVGLEGENAELIARLEARWAEVE
ncbi:hypothetical protein QBC34DRAFT_444089 [Podospora aff. communis PSN243]|uniref:Uncharacterized protein n=1 Tax=Podospora aff. communis PSN243 TaxID=3040156 RepID=A0AAV9G2V6_9PEZI|nr:hypothetical protein QBC34DRAFT_444089 [Podospora aff. communis PSN243]